ncbi:MAG: hypothetical protein WCD49_18665 [Candidatus Acidiferrales bacterium]
MSPRSLCRTTFAVFFAAVLCSGSAIWAQASDCPCPPSQNESPSHATSQPVALHSQPDFSDAQNKWQLEAADLRSQVDTVNPTLREERDAFWRKPLTEYRDMARGAASVTTIGDFIGNQPEFSSVKGATWVIATFESFHVYAVDHDYELLYTEVNFRVENVLKLPEGLSLADGVLVDAGIPGGRVKTSKGEIVTSRVEPQRYALQPGHRYLLQLLYEPKGEFFVANQRWDLTSGKVEPYTDAQLERLANKNSAIVGMSVPELIKYLPSVLPDEPDE